MIYARPRSAGKLHIGSVIYHKGVFSVEMAFVSASSHLGPDEMKSANLAATRHFLTLLSINGFKEWSAPDVKVTDHDNGGSCVFYIACRASRKRPAPIVIDTLRHEGRGQVDDKA